MTRRSTLDHSPQPDVREDGPSLRRPGDLQVSLSGRGPWRGGGGRWAIWALRLLLWAVLIIVGIRGVMAIVLNQVTPRSPASSASQQRAQARFPVSLAEAYALQFCSVYLDFSPATAAQRAQQLAAFVPTGADPELGWNGSGSLSLQSDQVAGINVRSAQQAVVTVLARVNGRLMELGVPVYAGGGGMVISGDPAWLPAPPRAAPPAASAGTGDAVAQNALMAQLPAFFQAYASGDSATIARFLARGAAITGLDGAVTFSSIAALTVPAGGSTRQVTVTVVWQLPASGRAAPAQLQMSYDMTVVRQGANWYVKRIQAAAQGAAAQS